MLNPHGSSSIELSSFDDAMLKILNSSLPEHEKVNQYYKLLQRKMNLQEFNEAMVTPLPETKEEVKEEKPLLPSVKQESPDFESVIYSSVPANRKKQAKALLHFLKTNLNNFKWNATEEVTYNGRKITKSNLADLFNIIFSTNRKNNIDAQHELIDIIL